jgi:hypothetical protein
MSSGEFLRPLDLLRAIGEDGMQLIQGLSHAKRRWRRRDGGLIYPCLYCK